MARVSSRSKPDLVPSRSIEVTEQLAGPALDRSHGELHGVDAGGGAAAMGEDFPVRRDWRRPSARVWRRRGIDGDDDALVAELVGGAGDEVRVVHGGGVDRDLVGAAQQELADILDVAHAAADRDRHEALLGSAGDDVEDGVAVVGAGGDVEEAELIGARRVIGDGGFDGIAGIDEIDELHALDDAAVLDVEAGDDGGVLRRRWRLTPLLRARASAGRAGSMRPS